MAGSALVKVTKIAKIQGRAEQSCITWSGITIGKLTPQHHMSLYNIELFHAHRNNPGQSKTTQLSNLDRYYYWKITRLYS